MLPAVNNNGSKSTFFSELIGIEVWSNEANDEDTYNLHVDVSFKKARLGGDSSSDVTFDLTLKAAELVVVVSEAEPLEILSNFTPRYGAHSEVTRTSVLKRANDAKASLLVEGSLGLDMLNLKANSKAAVSARHNWEQETNISEKTGLIAVRHSPSGNRSNTWYFESEIVGYLLGKPWDAVLEPRLCLRNLARSNGNSLAPCIATYLRCKKEDLIIQNIQVDDQPIWAVHRRFGGNQQLAAETFIKNKLASLGLSVGSFQNRYSSIDLAVHVHDSWGRNL